jgi:predicted ATP-grasp superfamily ATP-dependent carboligase
LSWPAGDESTKVDFLLRLSTEKGLRGWVLFPTDDEAVAMVARHYELLRGHYRLTSPTKEQYGPICNKWLLHGLASELKIDQPWTYCPTGREELFSLPCSFPVIVKPALREVFNRLTAEKAWQANDRQTLLANYDEACKMLPKDLILVQEVIPGPGEAQFSYAAVCMEGRPLAWVVARRKRQFPADYGRFSTAVETVEDPGIIEPSVRLLNALQYSGLIEIEFKRDARDGRFKVIDLNPRVWGWHTLGARAGVDFAYLQFLTACGEKVADVRARSNVHWARMNPDVAMAFFDIARGRLSFGQYLRWLGSPIETAIFTPDDPIPALLELPLTIGLQFKRFLKPNKTPASTRAQSKATSEYSGDASLQHKPLAK